MARLPWVVAAAMALSVCLAEDEVVALTRHQLNEACAENPNDTFAA